MNDFNERNIDACLLMAIMLVSYIGYRWNAHRLRQNNNYIFSKSRYGYIACVIAGSLLYWIGGRI